MNQLRNDDTAGFPGKLLGIAILLMLAIAGILTLGGDLGGTSNLIQGREVNQSPYYDDPSQGGDDQRGGYSRRLRIPVHRNKSVWQSGDDGRISPREEIDSYNR